MTQLTAGLHSATGPSGAVQFGALVSEGAGTTGVPKFWRAGNVSGDYGDARVVLYDAAGNPLLMGNVNNVASAAGILDALAVGRYDASPGALTDGRFSAIQLGSRGGVRTEVTSGTTSVAAGNLSDSVNGTGLFVNAENLLYDPVSDTWARERQNNEVTLFASAARTAPSDSAAQTNRGMRGVLLVLNVTVASGTGGVRPLIRSTVNGNAILNPIGAYKTATGIYVYELCPGSTGAGSAIEQRTSGQLPRSWDVRMDHGDASSYTYSLVATLMR